MIKNPCGIIVVDRFITSDNAAIFIFIFFLCLHLREGKRRRVGGKGGAKGEKM